MTAPVTSPTSAVEIVDRFWARVDRSGGPDACWPWTGCVNMKGYGRVWRAGRMQQAHRVALELTRGPIPPGRQALHRCDDPPCCNPAHLFVGTNADNVADRQAKGRQLTPRGESHGGAKLTEQDITHIRACSASGESHRAIAVEYGVARSTVSRIVRREYWAHVRDDGLRRGIA